MRAVEAEIVKIISDYQETGLVIGLTARGEQLKEDTERQLREIGIDFKGKIIFCGGGDKGEFLKSYIENSKNPPIHVAMADDKLKHLIHVMDALLKIGIQFTGLRYSFLDKKVFLDVFVKVKDNWRNNDLELKRFGYKE